MALMRYWHAYKSWGSQSVFTSEFIDGVVVQVPRTSLSPLLTAISHSTTPMSIHRGAPFLPPGENC